MQNHNKYWPALPDHVSHLTGKGRPSPWKQKRVPFPSPWQWCEVVSNNFRVWPWPPPGYWNKLTLPWPKLGQDVTGVVLHHNPLSWFKYNSGLHISKSLWGISSFQLAEYLWIWVFLSHCHLSQDIWSPYSFCQAHLACCCTEYKKCISKMGESILLWGKKTPLLMSPVGSFVLLMAASLEVKILLTGDCNILKKWKCSDSEEPSFCWFSPSKFASIWRNSNGSHIQSTPELGWVWTTQWVTSTSNQEVFKLEWDGALQDFLDHGSYKYRLSRGWVFRYLRP